MFRPVCRGIYCVPKQCAGRGRVRLRKFRQSYKWNSICDKSMPWRQWVVFIEIDVHTSAVKISFFIFCVLHVWLSHIIWFFEWQIISQIFLTLTNSIKVLSNTIRDFLSKLLIHCIKYLWVYSIIFTFTIFVTNFTAGLFNYGSK